MGLYRRTSHDNLGVGLGKTRSIIISERVKSSNLEYDVKATNQALIGEAKAWGKKISSEIMAFINTLAYNAYREEDLVK